MIQFLLGLVITSSTLTVFADDCRPGNCAEGQTCCPSSLHGLYTCCSHEDAVCCKDELHCCPKASIYNIETQSCQPKRRDGKLKTTNKLAKRQGLPAEERPFFQNRCDDETFCPYDSTCCMSPDGTYGCCPYLHGNCCPDKEHCCPNNEECDATSQYCIGEHATIPSKAKEPPFAIDEESVM